MEYESIRTKQIDCHSESHMTSIRRRNYLCCPAGKRASNCRVVYSRIPWTGHSQSYHDPRLEGNLETAVVHLTDATYPRCFKYIYLYGYLYVYTCI